MPCRELDPSTYSGALAADWNPGDDARAFYFCVKTGRMTVEQARADIGFTVNEENILHEICDHYDQYERKQIDRILDKRLRTLILFNNLMRNGGPVDIPHSSRGRVRSGSHRLKVEPSRLEPIVSGGFPVFP